MPRLRHTGGGYYIRGGPDFDPGDVVDVSEDLADRLADRPDFEVVDTDDADADSDDAEADAEAAGEPSPGSYEEAIADGVCPWCDDYEGDGVAQHASAAHPEAWASYREA